jgi:CYTH domain-containing protein
MAMFFIKLDTSYCIRATLGMSMSTRVFLDGVVLAEIELTTVDQALMLPDWIGAEVTSDPSFRKINMLAAHLARAGVSDRTEKVEPWRLM